MPLLRTPALPFANRPVPICCSVPTVTGRRLWSAAGVTRSPTVQPSAVNGTGRATERCAARPPPPPPPPPVTVRTRRPPPASCSSWPTALTGSSRCRRHNDHDVPLCRGVDDAEGSCHCSVTVVHSKRFRRSGVIGCWRICVCCPFLAGGRGSLLVVNLLNKLSFTTFTSAIGIQNDCRDWRSFGSCFDPLCIGQHPAIANE